MTFSSLISGTIPNHGKYNARPGKVTRVIQHHWAGTAGGIERLSNPTQRASATYLVLSDGKILGQVPEEFRPWTSGGTAADNPSITIECQNSTGAPDYRVSDAAFNAIVRLLADIAKRHGFGPLTTTTYRGHREFAATACPGPYLWPRLQSIRDAANALPGGTILVGSHGGVPVPVNISTPTPAPAPEDDMPITEAEYARLKGDMQATADSAMRGLIPVLAEAAGAAVWDHRLAKADETPVAARAWLVDTRIIVAQLPAMVIAALPAGGTGGVTLTQVEAAVKSGLATLQLKSV